MKKKHLIIGIIITFILIISISVIMIIYRNKQEQKVFLCNWYDYETSEVLTANTNKINYSLPYHFSASFSSNSDTFLDGIENNTNFIKEDNCFIEDINMDGNILFNNNNYYFLYETSTAICITNLGCTIIYNDLYFYIPLQDSFVLDPEYMSYSKEKMKNYFNTNTFNDSKEFYSRISEDLIKIDEINEIVTISALDMYSKERYNIYLNYIDNSISIMIGNDLEYIYK